MKDCEWGAMRMEQSRPRMNVNGAEGWKIAQRGVSLRDTEGARHKGDDYKICEVVYEDMCFNRGVP